MRPLDPTTSAFVLDTTGGRTVDHVEEVQSLWSGYGQVLRIRLSGATPSVVIAKRVRWPTKMEHPRGWTQSRSHDRKVRSYAVEAAFYQRHADTLGEACRVPELIGAAVVDDGVLLVLEDLNAAGFSGRPTEVGPDEIRACLRWLASFHATFLGRAPEGLWPVGTYWHLDTRPDELAAIDGSALAEAAEMLDERLSACPFQTFVHGDAKVANFCFRPDDAAVAAVDFQYVGGGCGIKDVAYFLSSCLDEDQCEQLEDELLEFYFAVLKHELRGRNTDVDVDAVCRQWRALYAVAWTDFYRFLAGWSPGHWKVHNYTRRLANAVLTNHE